MKKIVAMILLLSVTLTAAACGEASKKNIPDGTYEGVGNGRGGEIKVSLTVKENQVEEITVLEEQESEGLDEAINILKEEILATNNLDVDVVSGATLTSVGFRLAVQDAFSKSGADKSLLVKKEKPAMNLMILTNLMSENFLCGI